MELSLEPQGQCTIGCLVTGPIQTNTYVLISGDEALIVDPAWDGAEIARSITDEHPGVRVTQLLCTHGHADHVGGVAGLRAALPQVAFLLPADDEPMVAANIAEQRAWGIDTPDPRAPSRLIREGDAITVGDVRLTAIAVPGHTPGGMVYVTATTAGTYAFVGDTLFPGSHGRTDLTGGDETAILDSLSKLARLLPPETVCLTGHGPATTIARERATNPFMQA